jgi:hypothetical protein
LQNFKVVIYLGITELSEEVLLSTPSSFNVLTLKEKLELAIKEKAVNNLTSHQSKDRKDLLSLVKQEIAYFQITKRKDKLVRCFFKRYLLISDNY